jgi:hypothetical protein
VRAIAGPAIGGAGNPAISLSQAEVIFNHDFDLLQHLGANQSPICSFAVPIDRIRELGIRFDESLALCEDWDFLLRAALALPVHDTHRTTSVYQHGRRTPRPRAFKMLMRGTERTSDCFRRWMRSRLPRSSAHPGTRPCARCWNPGNER